MALPGYADFLPPPGLAELQRMYGYDDPSAFGLRQMAPIDMGMVGPGVPLPWDSSIPQAGGGDPMVSQGAPGVLTPPGPRGRLARGIGPRGKVAPTAKAPQVGRPSEAPEPEHPRLDGSALPQARPGGADAGQSILQQLMASGIGKKKEDKRIFGIPQSVFDTLGDSGLAMMAGRNNEVGRQAAAMMKLREFRSKEDSREEALAQAEQRMLANAMGQDERLRSQQELATMRDAYQRDNMERLRQQAEQGLALQQQRLGYMSEGLDERTRHAKEIEQGMAAQRALQAENARLLEAGRNARGGMGDYTAQWNTIIGGLEGQKNADGTYPPGVKERIIQAQSYRDAQANPRARIKDLYPREKKDAASNLFDMPSAAPAKPVAALPPQAKPVIDALRAGTLTGQAADEARKKLISLGLEQYIP